MLQLTFNPGLTLVNQLLNNLTLENSQGNCLVD